MLETRQLEGAIGVLRDADQFLVIRRSATVRAPGKLCFPGGGIEVGESQQQALVRELQEEMRLAVEPQRRLWSSASASGVRLHWWAATILGDAEPIPNPAEVAEFFWMTAAEMSSHPDLLETNRQFLNALHHGQFRLDDA